MKLRRERISPLNGFFLFLNHVCQLLEDGAQLNNCGLNILHGVCPALDVGILQRRDSIHEHWELLQGRACLFRTLHFAIPPMAHSKHLLVTRGKQRSNSSQAQSVDTCSSMSCSCWLVLESIMSMATSPEARDSAPKTTAPPPGGRKKTWHFLVVKRFKAHMLWI